MKLHIKTRVNKGETMIKMFLEKKGKSTSADEKLEVTLEIALKVIEQFPPQKSSGESSFVGFSNKNNETIRFIRFEENDWLIDYPVFEGGKYVHSLQDEGLSKEKVKQIVEKFSNEEDWKSLCNLEINHSTKCEKMNIFCPLIKEQCKGNECMMWVDEACIIKATMEIYVLSHLETEEEEEITISEEIPEYITSKTAEELAADLVSFVKNISGNEGESVSYEEFSLFWQTKNVSKMDLNPELQSKLKRAENIATQQILHNQRKNYLNQVETEKIKLPSLTDSCIDWAVANGLKRVTKSDLEVFLSEKNIEIFPETKRSLYATVNVKLKSRNKK